MKKKNYRLEIHCTGNNFDGVTGSNTLVTYGDSRILVDCGFIQCPNKIKQYKANKNNMKYGAKTIECIIITHCHLDHVMSVPMAVANGFEGKIYVPLNSKGILRIMFEDSLKINEKDIRYINRATGKEHQALFTREDMEKSLEMMEEVNFNTVVSINNLFSFEYLPNYHILNSASVMLYLDDKGKRYKKTVGFSGDLGNINIPNKKFLNGFEPIQKCDLLLCETTYGNKQKLVATKKARGKEIEQIKESILKINDSESGKMIMCTFANQRMEELLAELYELKDLIKVDVVVDSPLSIKLLYEYVNILEGEDKILLQEILSWDRLKLIDSPDESASFVASKKKAIVLTCSGFLQAGRVIDYLSAEVSNRESVIVLTGYFGGEGTLGHRLLTQRRVGIEGELKTVNATVMQLKTFTSHMGHTDLIRYCLNVKTSKIVLNHGDKANQYDFAVELNEKLVKAGNSAKVIVPIMKDTIRV